VHWSVPLIIFVPVTSYLLYRAAVTPGLSTMAGVILFLSGLFIWTIAEYLLHRFVFHYEPKSKIGQYLHFMMHGVHHEYRTTQNASSCRHR